MSANKELITPLLNISVQAGRAILDIYKGSRIDVDHKNDGSPMTLADQKSHQIIVEALRRLTPEWPILSEESASIDWRDRSSWPRFWLVDPLDGTKEFIKRNGEFTVNIALIEQGRPVAGFVHAPVLRQSYWAIEELGAHKRIDDREEAIRSRTYRGGGATLVASRSHKGEAVELFQNRLEEATEPCEVSAMGSSLKICLVAEGVADVYPRLGPTMEWDTAAAQCVLEQAGGGLTDSRGQTLSYNKPNLRNPWFLAVGDRRFDWLQFVDADAESKNEG